MKATVREHVPGAQLANAVPPRYRDEIVRLADPGCVYTLVMCAHNPRDLNLSSQLARAFRRIGSAADDRVVVVGAAFTEEAKSLAAERGASIVALHKTAWTDESARQRQL